VVKVVDCLQVKLQTWQTRLSTLLNEDQDETATKSLTPQGLERTHAMSRLPAPHAPATLDRPTVLLARGVMPVPAR
jgi:hypothetical protein